MKPLRLSQIKVAERIAQAEFCSFWEIQGQVFRVNTPKGKDINFDSLGHPLGKRWECSLEHFNHYRKTVFAFVEDCHK